MAERPHFPFGEEHADWRAEKSSQYKEDKDKVPRDLYADSVRPGFDHLIPEDKAKKMESAPPEGTAENYDMDYVELSDGRKLSKNAYNEALREGRLQELLGEAQPV